MNAICLDFSNWDRVHEIGLIDAPYGTGKTFISVHNLSDDLGIDRKDTLLLSPRRAIKEQTLEQYCGFVEEFRTGSAFVESKRVQIDTVHSIGRWYRCGISFEKPKLVIIDEFHTLFCEHIFAADLLYFQQQLIDWVNDEEVIIIALTATETLPLKFVNSCPFKDLKWIYEQLPHFKIRKICGNVEPSYKVETITVEQSKSVETVLEQTPANEDNKQLVFTRGRIERMINLAAVDEKSSWLCSKSSNTFIEGVRANELMNEEHYEALISGYLPQGINRMYLSSAYREGLNVIDPNVKEVIIEGCDDITLVQSAGRVRHSLERLIIVIDGRKYAGSDSKVKRAFELLESGNYEEYYKLQQEQELDEYEGVKAPILIYEDVKTNELKFNFFAFCYWLYEQYSIICARQTENQKAYFFETELPARNDYFNEILGKYTVGNIAFNSMKYIKPNTIAANNQERLDSFNWNDYLGVELFGQSAKDFANALGLKNKDNSVMAISGIYKHYPQLFEGRSRKRRNGSSPWVYRIAKTLPISCQES